MKIKNCELPAHLKGRNSAHYEHDTTAYKNKNFTMELNNGKRIYCRAWAGLVENWFAERNEKERKEEEQTMSNKPTKEVVVHTATGDTYLSSMNDLSDFIGKYEGLPRKEKKVEPIVPINTSFFDCGDVCVVTWSDGTTTKVRWNGGAGEEWNENLAITIAFIKKFHGLKMYDMLLDSVDKFDRDEADAAEAKLIAQQEAENERMKKYKKIVKKAARRRRKKVQFEMDVRREMNEEFS